MKRTSNAAASSRQEAPPFVGAFDKLRDLPRSSPSRVFSPLSRSPQHVQNPNRILNDSCFLVVFLFLFSLIQMSCAATLPSSSAALTIYALNANGLVHAGKVAHFRSVINSWKPHVFVVSETKTNSKLSSTLPYQDYNIFEESGIKTTNHHIYKWGIIVGIRKDLQVSQRLAIANKALQGRIIVVDVVLATNRGKGFLHRIIGCYAPWNPGGDDLTKRFWPELTNICQHSSSSWTMAGDFNATVSTLETASGGAEARSAYLRFLLDTNGHDLWTENDNRNRNFDWTSRAHGDSGGGNIIDRVATSRLTLLDAEITVADRHGDFIPFTDHRAVTARLIHSPPLSLRGTQAVFPPNDIAINKARIQYPQKSEKYKFQLFRDAVDAKIKAESIRDRPVTDDDSFMHRYQTLTKIITKTAEEVFGRVKRFQKEEKRITSPKIEATLASVRHMGGAIRLARNPHLADVSYASRRCYEHHAQIFHAEPSNDLSFVDYLIRARKQLNKDLFAERMAEIFSRARLQDRNRITAALMGASTKRLVNSTDFIALPLSVNKLDESQCLISDPAEVKETTRQYFSKLYHHQPPPAIPKPWLSTPSVLEVRERVRQDPFQWPRPASLENYRAMLRKGNPWPSPGPDEWEKWCIKSLSDDGLSLVLDLHNYEVMNATFPGDIKDMWITMFHKRGLCTDLVNWRGLFLSNFLANSPMTWLNHLLTSYSARLGLIPDTQVATQQGVQTHDLMSFLSNIKCWATRHKQPVYALKRDQMKGFDYLAPQGFYDAIEAYGLPLSIIDLDRASQTDTKCFIRTAHGTTEPITVTGVTKQGGPLSPIKSTYTTGMGHRYLNDLAAQDPDALIITTSSAKRGDPHLPDDKLQLTVSMAEATDDSFLFSKTIKSLRNNTLAMERFQFAYGWLTQWTKTHAYLLQAKGTHPTTLMMPSITNERGVDPLVVTEHEVPLIRDELEFLRTKVDDPGARYDELRKFIDSFTFPRVMGRPPITLLRKIVMQNIASKCRALLSLQPIKQADAELLDSKIITKVHELCGFPFHPSTQIATLPISLHGFNFPSIARINAGIAVEGLGRDLNHHVPAYRTMARIALADWMCEKSDCIYPLDGAGLDKDFTHYAHSIPMAWIVAQKTIVNMSPRLLLR
jgi:hypothetical protein